MTNISGTITYQNGLCLSDKIDLVYEIFKKTFDENKISEVFLSFNGGKDCTVLLHLVNCFLKNDERKIRVFYIQPENPFDEIEEFVDNCDKLYNIKIEKIRGKLKNVLEQICGDNPQLKAVIMGCRRTDPYCENLQVFQETDPSWPPLIRINPLLDWNCKDIWDYIKEFNIPYCSLYDDGYTSLGDKTNTKKNPYLKVEEDSYTGIVTYRPAYELTDDRLERAGRN